MTLTANIYAILSQKNYLGKRHISILSTRNVIRTLGGEGVGACDVSR